jgi:Flp pilus assembly protein TadG
MRRRVCLFHNAPGLASTEFALVLPLFMLLLMVVLALTIQYFSALLAAAGVPMGARLAGVAHSSSAGYGLTQRLMNVIAPAGAAAGAARIQGGAPGCQRAVTARLDATSGFSVPMLGDVLVRLRAGSQTRDWQFWAGQPDDGCE